MIKYLVGNVAYRDVYNIVHIKTHQSLPEHMCDIYMYKYFTILRVQVIKYKCIQNHDNQINAKFEKILFII